MTVLGSSPCEAPHCERTDGAMNGRITHLADLFHGSDKSHDRVDICVIAGIEGVVAKALGFKAVGQVFDHGCEDGSVNQVQSWGNNALTLKDR